MAQGSDAQRLLIEQGKFWQGEDKPTRAAEVWNRLLMLDASQPEALYGLGLIAVKDDDLKQARDYLARLQAIEPMPREALQLEQDIRLAEPANARLLEEARLAVDNDERAKADALYRRALGGKPAQGLVGREFYNNMGFLDAHWPESRAGFERLSRERPEDPYVALFFAKQLVRRDATRAEGIRALETLARREDIGGDAAETWRLALTWMGAPERRRRRSSSVISKPIRTMTRSVLCRPKVAVRLAAVKLPGHERRLWIVDSRHWRRVIWQLPNVSCRVISRAIPMMVMRLAA